MLGRILSRSPLSYREYSSFHITQTPRPVFGNDHIILDAHPAATGQVDARLDGESHAGFQNLRIIPTHEGLLVAFQPDAVAGAVREIRTVTGLLDHAARGPIHLGAGNARPGGG